MKKLRINNQRNNAFLGDVLVADTLFTRTKGLLGTKDLAAWNGLLIKPCKQVHTLGMRFPISVWYIDHENRIISIIDTLMPNRIAPCVRDSLYILEFPEKWAELMNTSEGDCLELISFTNKKRA